MTDPKPTSGNLLEENAILHERIAVLEKELIKSRENEKNLRTAEARLNSLFDSVRSGVMVVETDSRISYVNDITCNLLEMSREEIVGRSSVSPRWKLVHEDGRPFEEAEHPSRVTLDTGKAVHSKLAGFIAPGDVRATKWVIVNTAPIFNESTGAISQILITMHDVSERKKAEERLRESEAKMRIWAEHKRKMEARIQYIQKLESLGVLAGGVAHDFNNLLTGILGNASLALKKLPEQAPGRGNVQLIEKASLKAAELTRQLLAFSGKGKIIVEPVDLTALIEDMTELLKLSTSKKALIRLELTHNLPTVEADESQLRQVIMNLIINASDALLERGGKITVRTTVRDFSEGELENSFVEAELPAGRYVMLEVCDDGCGMDNPTLDRIFEPFFSTKFTGRGLGLAAVIGIVRSHKGTITVRSHAGKGSIFTVLLPASNRQPLNRSIPEHVYDGPTTATAGMVLFVDDEENVRQTGRQMLEMLGLSVLTARDGHEALQLYQQNIERISLVLLDMTMPRMGGEETFRELRRLNGSVPVILSSGYNEQEAISHFIGKGLTGFLQKPYCYQQLVEKINRAMPH